MKYACFVLVILNLSHANDGRVRQNPVIENRDFIFFYFYPISLASISFSHAKESIFIEEADKVSKLLLLRQLCFDSNRGHERKLSTS